MQLPSFTVPTENAFVAIFAAGTPTPVLPGPITGEGAFAQLFPDLASSGALEVKTGLGLADVSLPGIFSAARVSTPFQGEPQGVAEVPNAVTAVTTPRVLSPTVSKMGPLDVTAIDEPAPLDLARETTLPASGRPMRRAGDGAVKRPDAPRPQVVAQPARDVATDAMLIAVLPPVAVTEIDSVPLPVLLEGEGMEEGEAETSTGEEGPFVSNRLSADEGTASDEPGALALPFPTRSENSVEFRPAEESPLRFGKFMPPLSRQAEPSIAPVPADAPLADFALTDARTALAPKNFDSLSEPTTRTVADVLEKTKVEAFVVPRPLVVQSLAIDSELAAHPIESISESQSPMAPLPTRNAAAANVAARYFPAAHRSSRPAFTPAPGATFELSKDSLPLDLEPVAAEPAGAPRETASSIADLVPQLASRESSEPAPLASETTREISPLRVVRIGDGPHSDHSENAFERRGEKFAAPHEKNFAAEIMGDIAPDKTFLNVSAKELTSPKSDLGTDVAKPQAAMFAAPYFDRPAPVAVLEHAPVAIQAVAPAESPIPAAPLPATDAASAANRAVEAVLTAVDRFSSGERHAVNLQFSVGGAALTVRVELRADEVRTEFRTDSPELRTALTHEWQAVNADASSDRSFRLAAPVFSTTDSANLAAFSGDSAPRQRDANGRRTADEVFGTVVPGSRGSRTGAVTAAAVAPVSPRSVAPSTTHRLHTLA